MKEREREGRVRAVVVVARRGRVGGVIYTFWFRDTRAITAAVVNASAQYKTEALLALCHSDSIMTYYETVRNSKNETVRNRKKH